MYKKEAFFQKIFRAVVYNGSYRSLNNPNTPISSSAVMGLFGIQEEESGAHASKETALTISAYHRANEVLNHTLASLPISVFEKQKDGSNKKIDHDLNDILKRESNPLMSAFSWKELGQGQLNTAGNSYSRIESNASGRVTALWPEVEGIAPTRSGNRVVYKSTDLKNPIKYEDMLHIPGFGFDGIVGKPKIQLMAESLGLGLAYQKYASRYIKNDASSRVVLVAKGDISAEDLKTSRDNWQEANGGKNQGKVASIRGDWDVKSISSTPSDSQLLESRQFSVTEIARWTGVPPHLLFDLSRSTYNNIEHQMTEFVMFTILGWCTKWEQEINRKLFSPKQKKSGKYFVKHNLNALMRADSKSRADLYKALSQTSAFSANDILKLEDMNPVEGGDRRYTQMQNIPTDRVDEWLDAKLLQGIKNNTDNDNVE